MQVGIDSFAAAHDDASLSVRSSERLQRLVEQIEYADQIGLDVFGVGEHHRKEFLDSAPAVILAAAAARTKRIRLTSAVTVLSAADPVRVSRICNIGSFVARSGGNGCWPRLIYRGISFVWI
jgi:alkanesulfonate monooxygenase SsuD/methylene tetrahydromethanopterin reductase-like flavin-dependent oxidoreductase (luciferase family)